MLARMLRSKISSLISGLLFMLCFQTITGCNEEINRASDPTNQIVVIGNGANWSNLLVADIQAPTGVESMIVKNTGVSSVRNELQLDSSKNEPQPKSLQIDWVAPSENKSSVMKLKDVDDSSVAKLSQNLSNEKCGFYESDEKGRVVCKLSWNSLNWKEGVPPEASPQRLVYLDERSRLRLSSEEWKTPFVIAEDADKFLADSFGDIFFSKAKEKIWYWIPSEELMAKPENIHFNPRRFEAKAEIVFNGDDQNVFAYMDSKLYQFEPAHMKFNLVWQPQTKSPVLENILASTPFHDGRIYIATDKTVFGLSTKDGLFEIKNSLTEVSSLTSEGNLLFLSSDGLKKAEVCKISDKNFKDQICKILQSPIGLEVYSQVLFNQKIVAAARTVFQAANAATGEDLHSGLRQIFNLVADPESKSFGSIDSIIPTEGEVKDIRYVSSFHRFAD